MSIYGLCIENDKTKERLQKVKFLKFANMSVYRAIGIILFVFLCCSCSENWLYERRKKNIIGDWEIVQTYKAIRADTVFAEVNNTPFLLGISFFEDGTGEFDSKTFSYDFEWFYQYDPEMVLILGEELGSPSELHINTFFHEIIENEKDRQLWMHEVEVSGQDTTYLFTWEMSRK